MELNLLASVGTPISNQCAVELCGFGPIASAAKVSQLLAGNRYHRVLLIGIAGTYNEARLPVGSSTTFNQVHCDGVGIGAGKSFQSAAKLGWSQIESNSEVTGNSADSDAAVPDRDSSQRLFPSIGDSLRLNANRLSNANDEKHLLTCCSASSDQQEASNRINRFPQAIAEDMEGFGVAIACQLHDVPLRIIRGISNRVGDRDHLRWKIKPAMTSASKLAIKELNSDWIHGI